MADLGKAKTHTPKWVLEHLPQRQLEKMYEHLRQINLIAKSSGMWDFQRTGFFKQSASFEEKVRKAADKDVYGKRIERIIRSSRRRKK